jgi:hypothetical protein
MSIPLKISRMTAVVLLFTLSGIAASAALTVQDITGGSSSELASASEVESRSGKGVFTRPKEVANHVRRAVNRTIARVTTRPQRDNAGGGRRPENTGGGGTDTSGGSGKPLGDAARRVATASELKQQADDFFDAGQYEKAIETYKKVLQQRPDYPEAYVGLSEAYFNLGQLSEAIEAAKQAVAQKPNWAEPYIALGNAYLKFDRPQDAIEPLKKALTLEPQNQEARNSLSLLYYDQGVDAFNANKYDEAIAAYQQAVAVKPD